MLSGCAAESLVCAPRCASGTFLPSGHRVLATQLRHRVLVDSALIKPVSNYVGRPNVLRGIGDMGLHGRLCAKAFSVPQRLENLMMLRMNQAQLKKSMDVAVIKPVYDAA